MKKILILMLAVMLVMSFTVVASGCKDEAAPAEETTEEAAPAEEAEETEEVEEAEEVQLSGTINAMAFNWSPGTEMQDCFAAFTKDTGIEVNLEVMDFGVYYQTVTTRLIGGGDTDIIFQHAAPFFYPTADAGLYTPMEDFGIDSSFLYPVVRQQVLGSDGKTYIIPAGENAMVLLINDKIMEENGFDYPTSWEELMDLCQQMVDKDIVPFYSSFVENNTRYLWFPLEATKISYGEPDFWKKAKAGEFNPFADPRWREIMEQVISMWDNNYFDNELSPVQSDSHIMFAEGEAAMMLGGTWSLGILRDYQKEGFEYTASILPSNDANYPTNVAPVVAAVGWAAAANTQKFELVKAFQLWWVENLKSGLVNEIYGWPPAIEGAPFKVFDEAEQNQLFEILEGPAAPFTEAQMPSIEMIDFVDKELQDIFLGIKDLDTALVDMQSKWDELMEDAASSE